MAKRDGKTITLGSGELFMMEFAGTMPEVDAICVEENRLGYIKGGAAIEYTMEPYEEKSDLGEVSKIIVTSEEAILKAGLLTWNGDTLTKLVDRGTSATEDGKRITKIGGAGNDNGKNYVICFQHKDPTDGNLWALIKGKNSAGLTITFATDSGTLLEPEFKAMPHDEDGTLIKLIEEQTA